MFTRLSEHYELLTSSQLLVAFLYLAILPNLEFITSYIYIYMCVCVFVCVLYWENLSGIIISVFFPTSFSM